MNVRRLLSLTAWAANVRVLAGSADLGRDVYSVRATTEPRVKPLADELLGMTVPLTGTDWRLDALIRRAADAGAAALLLCDFAPLAATTLLAERLRLPVLVTVGDPIDLLVDARVAIATPMLDSADLVLATHHALDDQLRDPDYVVATLTRLLRSPVAVLDDRGGPLAGQLTSGGHVRVDELVAHRVAVADGVLLAQPVLLPRPTGPAVWLATELGHTEAERVDAAAAALVVACGAIQRWLLAHRLELERDARSRTALLADLLRLDVEPSAELRRRATDAGWPTGGWHVGLRIAAPPTLDPVSRTPDVVRALASEGVNAVVVEHGAGWTGWVTFPQEPTVEQVRILAGRLRTAHRVLRRTIDAHLGVGRPHPHAHQLASTIAEATDAARLAAARPESGYFLHVDHLGMAQQLLAWTRTDTFKPEARALLAPLGDPAGDLVRTLMTYLNAGSSVAETAAILGVHRNTVTARVSRIEQRLSVELDRPDDRLALHLAVRAIVAPDENRAGS